MGTSEEKKTKEDAILDTARFISQFLKFFLHRSQWCKWLLSAVDIGL